MTDTRNPMPSISRRNLLAGATVIGAGLVATACGTRPNTIRSSSPATGAVAAAPIASARPVAAPAPAPAKAPARRAAPSPDDVKIAQLAAGLEVLAVGTYKAALDAAGAGKLGEVPPAVAEFATVATKHHQAHLDAWNKVLTSNGAPAVTQPDATLKPVVDSTFAGVKDVGGVAALALMLEQVAAATYLSAQGVLSDKDAIKLAGSIQVVDAQHVSVLLFVLGQYPVPDTFARIDMAAAPAGMAVPGQADSTSDMPSTK